MTIDHYSYTELDDTQLAEYFSKMAELEHREHLPEVKRFIAGGAVIDLWKYALDRIDDQRAGTWFARNQGDGPIVVSCLFHEERTPSMVLWESGNFLCHGCGQDGNISDIITFYEIDTDELLQTYNDEVNRLLGLSAVNSS